jgi:hypothetical protein
MERDTIIFSGQSHTLGLGLEWELDPELNSEEYLQKGISIPIPRLPIYENYWRERRWPTLVCNELGYKQFNIHDRENQIKIGGDSVNTLWMMVRDEDKIQPLLAKTKYVIIEAAGHVRWYDEKLHGQIGGDKYPNTIMEMIKLINDPHSDQSIVAKTLQWINDIDVKTYTKELHNKIQYLIKKYPEIKFLVLPWHTSPNEDSIHNADYLKKNLINISYNNKKYVSVNSFLSENKLHVWNKAKGFNGNYKFNHLEDHASMEGHQLVANMVIENIKQIENPSLI